MLTTADKELLRHVVLDCLVLRHPTPLTAAGIARRIATELDFVPEPQDLASVLTLLAGTAPPLIESILDTLGPTLYYRATAAGILANERRQ